MAWSDRFEDPIPLPGGRALVTFEDAAGYIQKLPRTTHRLPEWQTATEILIAAAEGRDFRMHARIAVLKALNRDRPPPAPGPRRKKARVYRVIPAKIT
jgi:hypothetical protein